MDTVNCVQCGSAMPRTARYCPECGHENAPVATSAAGAPGENAAPSEAERFRSEAAGTGPVGGAPTVNMGISGAPSYGQPVDPVGYTTPPGGYTPPPGGYTPPPSYAPAQTQSITPYPGAPPPAPVPTQNLSSGYSGYSQNPMGYQSQPQIGVAGVPQRDPTVALLLELVGYLGFLGIGHLYAGFTTRGVSLLIGWWLYWGIVGVLFATIVLSPVACVMIIAWPIVPILSGLWARRDLERQSALSRRY